MSQARNVLGEPLAECCSKPMTGFYRNGSCDTGPEDLGVHTVCIRVDAAFLAFSQAHGNDLSTPVPAFGFPGLKPGDCWCLCAERWKEALEAGLGAQSALDRDPRGDPRHRPARIIKALRHRPELTPPVRRCRAGRQGALQQRGQAWRA